MLQKTLLAPGNRDGAKEEKAKEEEEKEVRATTIGDRSTAHGRSAKTHRDTRLRNVQSQNGDTRSPAGRSAKTTTATIARKAALIAKGTADIAKETIVEGEADGEEVAGTVAEAITRGKITSGETIGARIAETKGGHAIDATTARTTGATIA